MSEAKKAHWKQGKNGNFRDVVFLVPWDESNGIPLDRNMWIDCNSEENSRLIAAAPDLLEALYAVLHDCENLDMVESNEPGRDKSAYEMIHEAIAKATKVQT